MRRGWPSTAIAPHEQWFDRPKVGLKNFQLPEWRKPVAPFALRIGAVRPHESGANHTRHQPPSARYGRQEDGSSSCTFPLILMLTSAVMKTVPM